MANETEIGAFEAKARLSELLRGVVRGRAYLITRRGKPVARLLPVEEPVEDGLEALLGELHSIRSRVKGKASIGELIADGRRR
ncbi:MAG: type II toxin-antitoxin system prevent-host-death family antitoxin [Deltaproteobacteria bacterium]|nr:type II toxin-antitoxin system prevent-host-death family antitoxin [Deltaproteobacteria bacterium]